MLAQALAQQQAQPAPVQVRPVAADIQVVLGSPVVDKVDMAGILAAGMDTRQAELVAVAVRIEVHPAAPSVAVAGLRQASDAKCSHNSNI